MKIYSKIKTIQKWLSVTKDKRNEFLKNAYVTLDQIVEKLEPLLEKEGLFMFHKVDYLWLPLLVTHIRDIEGEEEIISSFPMHATDPQRVWSEITYGKRYNLSAIFNIIADEDDDWNKASGIGAKTAPRSLEATPQGIKTPKLLAEYIAEIKQEKDSNVIRTLQDEAKQGRLSEKQIAWLDKEVETRLQALKN